jgi:hypothetical protein
VDIGDSIKRSLDHWERREWDVSMLHACNAVDGTAKKRYPQKGVATRFKSIIRESLDIFGSMAAPAIDFEHSRFPIAVKSDLPDGRPDIADVLYGIHRWSHGHEEDLPHGFELTPHGPRPSEVHIWKNERIQVPGATVIGLLAIAVFAPENKDEKIPDGYQVSWFQYEFNICLWWGWQDHYREIISTANIPQQTLDFFDSWDNWKPR